MGKKYAERFGFDKIGDRGRVVTASLKDALLKRVPKSSQSTLVNVGDIGWPKLVDYDKKFTAGVNREAYLKSFIGQNAAHAKVRHQPPDTPGEYLRPRGEVVR